MQVRRDLPPRRHAHAHPRPGTGAAPVPGLSGRTHAAIARVERRRSWPGLLSEAWRRWHAMAHRPGRWPLYAVDDVCECCDPYAGAHVRAVLEDMCRALPRRPAAELRAALAPLDARFLARTLNDPFAAPGDPWWARRLTTA